MRVVITTFAIAIAVVAASPIVGAHECGNTEPETPLYRVKCLSDTDKDCYYVTSDGRVYRENNGVDGMQREEGSEAYHCAESCSLHRCWNPDQRII